ncbi:MAG TPA: hypothetical protein VD996_04275 [Chitinophagaceae bacterium]|nr:hypothetical protein [Chitinophagaceae bacterium]
MQPAETYKTQIVPIEIEYGNNVYKGEGRPIASSCHDGVCFELDLTLNDQHLGIIRCTDNGWQLEKLNDPGLANAIGEEIKLWYS